jgi:hypothetical protein
MSGDDTRDRALANARHLGPGFTAAGDALGDLAALGGVSCAGRRRALSISFSMWDWRVLLKFRQSHFETEIDFNPAQIALTPDERRRISLGKNLECVAVHFGPR